jgi:PAS domain S-box-containing protein
MATNAGRGKERSAATGDGRARHESDTAARYLAAVVESSDDAIVSKGLDGVIKTWNPGAERIFGYTAAEAVGKSIRLIIPPARRNEEDDVLRHIANGERVEHFETVRRRKDGSLVDISLTVSPIRDEIGRIVGASKIAKDISKEKEAEVALRDALAVKDEFLSLVSHELRNPITTILGNARLLLRVGPDVGIDWREALDDIEKDGSRLQHMIEDLLVLARPERGERLVLEPVSLQALLRGQVTEHLRTHPHRQVAINPDDKRPLVFGNSECLEQVIRNLLSNAEKYTPEESPIDIEATQEGDMIQLSVADRGPGIDPTEADSVFSTFYRAKKTLGMAPGLGVGLAVCKQLVEAQDGHIWAESRDGGGSVFRLSLPVCRE